MSTAPVNLVADRYRLVEPLGQGGMGRVWKARDEVLHRDVAIKELVPPPGLTDEERREMRDRSLREARAIAQLNNINVVRVFDVLRTDGDPWIVMEYVPSRSLQEVLATDGPVSPIRGAEIGLGVLGALRAAHRAGVMHRDVKPGNVLLGDDGRVVLTDFGLATVPGDPTVTRTGLVLGSPAYISPERAKDGKAGPEADLWSLGATLYAAVEGHSPYARPSAMGTLAALATEPPPPSKNAGPLRPVLAGLLRKNPAERISLDEADRLLRRAAGRKGRGAMSLLDGVRRPDPSGRREPRPSVLPAQRPPAEPSAGAPAAAAAVGAAAVGGPAAVEGATAVDGTAAAADAASPATGTPADAPERMADTKQAAPAQVEPTKRVIGSARLPIVGKTTTDSRNRRNLLILVVAALLVLGIALAVSLLGGDPERKPGAQQDQPSPARTSAAPQTSGPAAGRSSAPPPATSQPANPPPGLPAGWRLHSDPTGFKVPVPVGWRESRQTSSWGPQVYFNGPGSRRLMIDQTPHPQPDALADSQAHESNKRASARDYERVGEIRRVDGYFADAADWDWLETINGVRMHVRSRNFITTPGKQAYQIQFRLPVSEWDRVGEAQFKLIANGFEPRR